MKALNKHAELHQLAEKATQGEWWSDVVETDGEYGEGEDRASGYHSYAVYVGSESLLDMTNSTAACIHTEWDHDYLMAWDETAKRNAEFIAAANPETVLALLDELDELEAAQSYAKERDEENQDLMLTVGRLRVEKEAAEKRIAELEARTVMLPQYRNSPDMHTKQFYEAIGFNQGLDIFIEALRAAGIGVKGE